MTTAETPDAPEAVDTAETVETDVSVEEVASEVEPETVAEALRVPVVMERPILTVGRRKEAVVRIRLVPGTGKYTLNGKQLAEYFPNKVHQQLINDPFVLTERTETFDVLARLHGGGTSGQAGALRLAIARALIEVQPDDRPVLKRAGFLTRDPRATERKKYGLKKARKAPQYSKR
ncbi:30S ribosomal protein S9 [Rhodococcus antarcticus]|uniref:Small ribosomal subunit protein uS9 n=1 Tax=Rhodococcus antarcticus TaxID=2987751 RepID=A0ABY6P562_9NOCA|nr:30S ribosomal protein S9 [Rhodococcus antarcticus]UZJ26805.1 30S ribosomal protein S9 [Rhodococcus antarcticus]